MFSDVNSARLLKKTLVSIAGLGCATTLVACQGPTTSDMDESSMGSAQAVSSPAATDPAGKVIELDEAYAKVSDMERAGETLAVRSGEQLVVGTLDAFTSGDVRVTNINGECGDMTATTDEFVLACPDGVHIFEASSGTEREVIPTSEDVSTAVKTSDGTIIAGVKNDKRALRIHNGEEKEFSTEYDSTEMIAVPVDGREDAVLRTNSRYTIIQDLKWKEPEAGAILRVGMGVGHIAPAEKGMALATDTLGSQLMIYFADDVVRLQKTVPVDESPWGVAWDSENRTAWVASTAENQLVGWDVAASSMTETERFNTIANVRSVAVMPDGSKVLASASGDGLQVIK